MSSLDAARELLRCENALPLEPRRTPPTNDSSNIGLKNIDVMLELEQRILTYRGSITVQLTSCLDKLDRTKQVNRFIFNMGRTNEFKEENRRSDVQ